MGGEIYISKTDTIDYGQVCDQSSMTDNFVVCNVLCCRTVLYKLAIDSSGVE